MADKEELRRRQGETNKDFAIRLSACSTFEALYFSTFNDGMRRSTPLDIKIADFAHNMHADICNKHYAEFGELVDKIRDQWLTNSRGGSIRQRFTKRRNVEQGILDNLIAGIASSVVGDSATHIELRRYFTTDSTFRAILADAISSIKQELYNNLRDEELDTWTHLCMIYGIAPTKLCDEAYIDPELPPDSVQYSILTFETTVISRNQNTLIESIPCEKTKDWAYGKLAQYHKKFFLELRTLWDELPRQYNRFTYEKNNANLGLGTIDLHHLPVKVTFQHSILIFQLTR